ncbi:uncharacterized protein LOC120209179 [Hibiscus syriacus]|uniref:uncharacterized protein LOC120209179 n=1 Tax=Hibiscus syriacus TaxID=106335 RepID=UPI001921188E|nr:uncharacterized protein LOC120209179 [Hibiscus syriacus]
MIQMIWKHKLDVVRLFFIVRFRIASWFVAKFKDVHIPLDSLVGDLKLADLVGRQGNGNSTPNCWVPPPDGFLKLNVDGAMAKGWEKGGIGGLIRDSKDSSNALKWIKSPGSCAPMFQLLVKDIVPLMAGKDIIIKHILRAANWEADKLAKDGIR